MVSIPRDVGGRIEVSPLESILTAMDSARAAGDAAQQSAIAALADGVMRVQTAADLILAPADATLYAITAGYYASHDGGGARYRRVATAPAHGAIVIRASDGAIWELAEFSVNPRMCGARGDGASDDSLAFQRAVNLGRRVEVSAGLYNVQDISITKPVEISLSSGATLRQHSAVAANRFLISFEAGSDGSSLRGGVLDGRRATLGSQWVAPDPIYTQRDWCAFRVAGAASVTVRDVLITNFVTYAFNCGYCDDLVISDIVISNCGKAGIVQYARGIELRRIYASGCGNAGKPIYQHLWEIRGLTESLIDTIEIDGWNPDAVGLEPFPIAITLNRLERCDVRGLAVKGFAGASPVGGARCMGVMSSYSRDCQYSGWRTHGCTFGVEIDSAIGGAIRDLYADGEYYSGGGQSIGVCITDAGQVQTDASNSAYDTLLSQASRRLSISGVVGMRSNLGVRLTLENAAVANIVATGNTEYGCQVRGVKASAWFPGRDAQCATRVTINGVIARLNAQAGIVISGVDGLTIGGAVDVSDNGWDTSVGAQSRVGVSVLGALDGGVRRLQIGDISAGATPSWTKSRAASYQPGASAAQRKRITMTDTDGVDIGTTLTLKSATATGDIAVRVVDMIEEEYVVEAAADFTLVETSALVALTGTVAVAGQVVTGAGTAFTTEVTGHCWLKIGGAYALVSKVINNTTLYLQTPMTVAAGASAQRIGVDAAWTPTQQYGISIDSAVAGPVSTEDVWGAPVVAPQIWSSITQAAPGARVTLRSSVALDPANWATAIFYAIPAGVTPLEGKIEIANAVAGTAGASLRLECWEAGTSTMLEYGPQIDAAIVGTAGASAAFPFTPGALSKVSNVVLALRGGTDAIPSSGNVTATLILQKPWL